MVNFQYIITIMSKREVSHLYHNIIWIRGFSPWNGERFLSLGQSWRPSQEGGGVTVWLGAWKLVSNDAKRTVAPPNAKHSTLPQGCFLCFCFWLHSRFGNNIIIAHVIFHWAHNWAEWTVVKDWSSLSCNSSAVPRWLWRWCEKRFARLRKKLYLCIAFREIHPWWQRSGYSSVRLEYTSGGRGVAGSNPVIPTTQKAW